MAESLIEPPLKAEATEGIEAGFAQFITAARRLEESYAALQQRAADIDLQLAASNQELEQTLLEREMIFAALPVGLSSTDARGVSRWSNPEGQRIQELCSADLQALPEGESDHGGLPLRVRHVGLPDGGRLSVVEDRSQVSELQREVDRLDRLAGLSELALGIAHEIKNPLNGVMGFAALMQRSQDPEQLQGYARRVNQGLGQVDAIVKGLLAFARPADAAGMPAPLQQVLHDAAAAASLDPQALEVSLTAPLDEHSPVEASALVRVLSNLFRNAAEAKARVRIRVAASWQGGQLQIEVQDDGPGVPEPLADRVFQPFVSTKAQGHGLGLALCCRVLSFLDGSLELCNPGQPGARFLVRVPMLDPEART